MGTVPWLAGVTTLVLLAVAALTGHLNFVRWDNMETFLPAVWYAHSELLQGRFPLWNPHQNLGEPMHALGIGGVLYPPYTLAVAIVKLLRWPEVRALDLIAVSHCVFAAVGLSKLLGELRVRASIAFVAAVSGALTGYALIVGAIWVHMIPNLAWCVWAMWGLRRVLANERPRRGAVVAIVALTAVLLTGHVQTGAYVWLAVWLWTLGVALATGVLRQRLLMLLLIASAAALMAVPTLLPQALILSEATRMEETMTPGRGFRPFALLGLLIPTIRASDGALVHPVIVTTFAGAWIVPGLLLGLGVVLHRRMHADKVQMRIFLVTLLTALLLIWLNFGPDGGLYTLLHKVPVWSRFRVPYKYFERAVPLLVIAGALGLEMAARREPPRGYALAVLGLFVVALVSWIALPAREPLVLLAGVSALLTLLILAVLPAAGAALALLPLVIVQSIGVIGITHAPARSKSYVFDRAPAARLPITEKRSRVLPLSEGPPDHPYTRPLAIFYAPTLDGYSSASGHRFALTSHRYEAILRTSVAGVPTRGRLKLNTLLQSNFLQLLDVGQLVVAAEDTAALNEVARLYPNARVTRTPQARIFQIRPPTLRAFFATEQRPGNNAATHEVLFASAPLHAVTVEGDTLRRALPRADVTQLRWQSDYIEAEVDAPEGGLLVFSTTYSPEWTARTDQSKSRIVVVDEFLAGVWVPPGTQQVTLQIRRWPIYVGLLSALAGIAILVFTQRRAKLLKTPEPNPLI